MTPWTFSLPVSEHTSNHMSNTWEGNWKCTLELKRWESCNGLKGRSWTMSLPQVSKVFSSHLIIRQYSYMYIYPKDKDVKFLTSCSLYITLIFSTWHVAIDFRSYVHSNSHPMMIWIIHCLYSIHNTLGVHAVVTGSWNKCGNFFNSDYYV